MESWSERVDAALDAIRRADRWRSPVDLDADTVVTGAVDSRPIVSFAANDYLGLSHHPTVVTAAHDALDRWGAGSGAARLVVGSRPIHSELEATLADWKQADDAVLFATGFAANLGVLASLGTAEVTIFSDELNHASIIDGCRLARGRVQVYRHNDLDHLAELLAAQGRGPAIVVTDTVFSMDGDCVDLDALVALAADYDALLVLDEAHAVLGPELDVDTHSAATVLRVGTLSKTLGSLGGFVVGPRPYIDLLRNVARPYIFTTASTPADTAAALAAVQVLRSAEGEGLKAQLREHVDRLRPGHPSPILPMVLGEEGAARAAASALAERGLLVPAIRPPTVPPGTSRLRVALSAVHTVEQVEALRDALAEVASGWLQG